MSSDTDATLDPRIAAAVAEYVFDRGWSDGLPALAATEEARADFLAHTDRDPDEVIVRHEQLGRTLTVGDVATHAIMAGCRPEFLPVVIAAWDALALDRTARGGGWQSTSGPAPLVVVNGPLRHDIGVNSAGGVLGPGFRPNSTIPRAIGLAVRNGLGIRPHEFEQATQGIPGRWSMGVGEDEESSPWEPLSVDGGLAQGESGVSVMLVRTCEFVDNRHFTDPVEVLRDIADTMQRTGSWIFRHASVGVVMNPDHARVLAEAGMTKRDVRAWLFAHAGRTEAELAAVGKGLSRLPEGPFPDDHFHPVFADAEPASIPIIVAGSANAAMSMVFRVFGRWSGTSIRVG
ncbi:hypothetical protein P0L94_12840 [Microbacter sp. GSS18]|nr:hypothetical protein P0L94_12840 [Microbacter sp. GSS18]